MVIQSGTHLGPYEIVSAIGAGGMGEVYRARDPKLGRDVAIKVLPEAFARDSGRMARFQREAKVLASLDHPNIASIYGFEDSGGTRALVMQLVDGPTLADRIRQGPIPVDEAVRIARQIADALEYAHERGIIHRDLKPSNVKLTADDAAKVLDFGLAKALEGDVAAIDISTSPTISRMATQQGVLLGTAAYMSPEQAKAKPVDRRADIWAFGCVLYEMLTGKQAFTGETVTDTLASIIKEEPDLAKLPASTPMRLRVLLQRCLQKDPKQRLRDIGDARIALDEVITGAPEDASSLAAVGRPAKKPWGIWLLSGVAGVFILATALLAFLYFHQKAPAVQAMRFEIPLPANTTLPPGGLSVSPDGHKLAFVAIDNGQSRVWVRSLEATAAQPLGGTEGVSGVPFWSPDSRYIAFPAKGKLMKIEVSGGPALTLCDAPDIALSGMWTPDDKIVFGSTASSSGLAQVPASGGASSPVTTDGSSGFPSLLPDRRHFVYFQVASQRSAPGIYVTSLDAKPGQPPKRLLADTSPVVYAPSSSDPGIGYLLFVRTGTLMAQPFDTKRLELTGDAVPIAENILTSGFSASNTNVLAYMTGTSPSRGGSRGNIQGRLTWFDRDGKVLGTVGDPGVYRTLALSPDGKRVAFERADPQNSQGSRNIWLYEFERGVTTRFTFDSGWDFNPVWSPDGSRIVFGSDRGGGVDIYEKTSNLAGEDEVLVKGVPNPAPSSWSPDGHFLLYYNVLPPTHVWLVSLSEGGSGKPVQLEQSDFIQAVGRFSPDGRWIAYLSNESGRSEIYVRPFDASSATGSSTKGGTPVTGKWMVSKDGGTTPLWRHDGKDLFYLSNDGMAMSVEVNTQGVFQAGIPKPLFKVPAGVLFWDVSSDGKRFLMAAPSTTSPSAPPKFTVVLNWQAPLKK